MARFINFQASICVIFGFAAPAWADVTPEDVWQNWQDMGTQMGQAIVAGKTARDGDRLTISDVTIASSAGGVTAESSIAELVMQDQGDGTVKVTMSPDYPIKMRLPAPEAGQPEVEMNITVTSTDLVMLASGSPEAISYDLAAPTLGIKLQRIEGVDSQAAGLTLNATFSDMAGVYATQMVGGKMTADSNLTVKGIAIASTGSNPAEQSDVNLTAAITDVAIVSKGALLGALAGTGVAADMLANLDSQSKITAQAFEFDAEVLDANGSTTLKGTAGAMLVDSSITGGVMAYDTTQEALALTINSPSIPVPDVAVTLDAISFAVTSPLAPSDNAQPFAFVTKLVNLGLSDQIWAIFDPSGQLPRDPINLVIDADGMAKVNGANAGAQGALPADLQSLNLKELRLGIAGAELRGSGASTFAAGAGGMPDPNAKLDFTLKGANALMDKVVAAGLIPPEALTMPRMMLAMVARQAADGSDSYTSTVEIKNKSIFANGQKLHQME
ncbi:MAG: hypothetical protein U5N55_08175 [Cypionkella sp.]|nr:hypothetical protein [Cypionkella sp.]